MGTKRMFAMMQNRFSKVRRTTAAKPRALLFMGVFGILLGTCHSLRADEILDEVPDSVLQRRRLGLFNFVQRKRENVVPPTATLLCSVEKVSKMTLKNEVRNLYLDEKGMYFAIPSLEQGCRWKTNYYGEAWLWTNLQLVGPAQKVSTPVVLVPDHMKDVSGRVIVIETRSFRQSFFVNDSKRSLTMSFYDEQRLQEFLAMFRRMCRGPRFGI